MADQTKKELKEVVAGQAKEIASLKQEVSKIDVLQKQIDALASKKKFKGSKLERAKKFKGRTAADFVMEQRLLGKKI